MNNKIIVITGCSSGIGLATANHLSQNTTHTIIPTARKQSDVEHLISLGFESAMRLDVTQEQSIIDVVDRVVERYGRIDVWFNNAGFGQPGYLEDITPQLLREQFETNVVGLHRCTVEVLKQMRKQQSGLIIQHSSVLGLVSLAGRGAYNASKYAIEGLSDTLRLELEGSGIDLVLLNTGPIYSAFRTNAMAKLKANIDIENSRFKTQYAAKLKEQKSSVPFSQEASEAARVVAAIISAKRPKPRYYITKATYLLGFAKRILSTSMLDRVLKKI